MSLKLNCCIPDKQHPKQGLRRPIPNLSSCERIKLFRERFSEKVHVTIPKGIVGGFEFTVLQRKLIE